MERKIGEKFTVNGKTYVTVRHESDKSDCNGCALIATPYCVDSDAGRYCVGDARSDKTDVHFEEVIESTTETPAISENKDDSDKDTRFVDSMPFDIEQAKAGKPVCTRNGCKARIICFDAIHEKYPIIALITEGGHETPVAYTISGGYRTNGTSKFDLVMVPKKKKGWIGIYRSKCDDILAGTTQIYSSKEEIGLLIESLGHANDIIEIKEIEWEDYD